MPNNITWIESKGKSDAQSPTSSALGLGQFVNRTWLEMIKRLEPDLARGKSDAEILAMRTNAALSQKMTDAYATENEARLRRAGVPVTPTSTYLMHFAGPGGGVKLMKADPNTPVESIFDDNAIKANPFLRGKTASWVIAWANKKVEDAATSQSNVARRRVPWSTGGQPVPWLAQTQAAEPAFDATSWPQRPASPNLLSPDAARRIAGALSAAPIPFLEGTMRAQQALDNSLPAPGAAPWDLSDRFGKWSGLGGVLGPASASYASIGDGYDAPSPPATSAQAPNAPELNGGGVPAVRRSDIRRLSRRDDPSEADVFRSGAPPVPYLSRW
ncbi:hypothetical protein JQ544_25450 [Bradyrhizobium diazoefficiens]|nr:hypothetical protein [Bradyrhizobium diazoefficiens]MBR0814900.1 hypothetical protein [Bradyrhizobium diazoefficiens]